LRDQGSRLEKARHADKNASLHREIPPFISAWPM